MKTPQELNKIIQSKGLEWTQKQEGLKSLPNKKLDDLFLHHSNKVWKHSDCLTCANCCRNISPIVEFQDIHNMARHLKIEAGNFIDQYLEMDEDGDFVFKTQPCPMLNLSDNKCKVYESRPKACREYPHLDQVQSKKMLNLAFQNASYCGVVFDTIESIKEE